jgi:hypothetical protein
MMLLRAEPGQMKRKNSFIIGVRYPCSKDRGIVRGFISQTHVRSSGGTVALIVEIYDPLDMLYTLYIVFLGICELNNLN